MGVAIAFTVAFLIGAEVWKKCKRIYFRAQSRKGTESDTGDVFEKYASFSKDNTLV